MSINTRDSWAKGSPYVLLTVELPSVTIRLASPEPLDGPLEAVDAAGLTRSFFPGLLGPSPRVVHSLLGGVPGVDLAFRIPRVYGVDYPSRLSWDQATAELAQWFPGTAWEDRRVLLSDRLSRVELGGADEPVTARLEALTEDRGQLLPSGLEITPERWPDVMDSPSEASGSGTAFDSDILLRAYQSSGDPYGEVFGYPLWALGRVVANQVLADPSVSPVVSYRDFKVLICAGRLARTGVIRKYRFVATERANATVTYGISSTAFLYAEDDAAGDEVTILQPTPYKLLTAYTSGGVTRPRFYPDGTSTADIVEGLKSNGTDLRPGDFVRLFSDGSIGSDKDAFFRCVWKVDAGSELDGSYFGVGSLDDDYYDSATSPAPYSALSAEASGTLTYVPMIRDARSCYLQCSEYGGRGRLGDPTDVLWEAGEVFATYLQRSEGIRVDFGAIAEDAALNAFRVDGQLLESGLSPLAWIERDLVPLLPFAKSWEGPGLRFRTLDPTETAYLVDVDLGSEGSDGIRLSRVSLLNPTSVINAVDLRYGWDESLKVFTKWLFTVSEGYSTQAAPSSSFVVHSRAMTSQRLYGRRSVAIETKWINNEDTARAVVNGILNRYHKPRWRLAYQLRREYGFLGVGDVVRMTDSELGISSQLVRLLEVEHGTEGPSVVVEEMG